MGWSSSASAAFDFRTNGSALPMYGLFLICLVIFFFGVRRHLRGLGLRGAAPPGGFTRLLEFGLLQRRIVRHGRSRWVHLPIFWGFVVLALGSLTIMVDGYLLRPLGLEPSKGLGYRVFQASLDLFGLAFLLGVGLAIRRRAREPASRPFLIVLLVLFGIGLSGFVLEGQRIHLEGTTEPWAFVGSAAAALIAWLPSAPESGVLTYRLLWWVHLVAAFGLIAALPYSPLRHVFTAPLNIFFSAGRPSGGLVAPFNLKELLQSGRFDVQIGARSIEDFSGWQRVGIAACADSGGCEKVCPAHATGTALSPRRLLETLREGGNENGSLSEDAIWSCTLCGACTFACPALVDPSDYIVELRRGRVAANRLGKKQTNLLSNLVHARNPYGSNNTARDGLAAELGLPTLSESGDVDMLYWIGCAATFDARARDVARAMVKILGRAGIRCAVLGPEELCCGDPARRTGEEGLFQDLAFRNIETIERHGGKAMLTHCAHCFNTFRNEYPQLGARFEVLHHATAIHELIESGAIAPVRGMVEPATLHDSCYVGRFAGSVAAPREVLRSLPGATLKEMERSGEQTFCCGAGGANYWYDVPRRETAGAARLREAAATGARILVTECPFCLKVLEGARRPVDGTAPLRVRDIAEVVAEALGPETEA